MDAKRNRIHVLGRLSDGKSFAASAPVPEPLLCIRVSDGERASTLIDASRLSVTLEPTDIVSFDGSPCVLLSGADRKVLDRAVAALKKNRIDVFGAETKGATAYLVRKGIRAGIRIAGECREGLGVDLVFPDANIEPEHKARAPIAVLSIDIETEEPSGLIRAVALSMVNPVRRVLLFSGQWNGTVPPDPEMQVLPDERSLLSALVQEIRALDPDIITGWNIIDFDFPRLSAAFSRCGIPFALGRSVEAGVFFPAEKETLEDAVTIKRSASVFLPGRQVLDGLRLVRTGYHSFESYTLDAVATEVLGKGKTVRSTDGDKLAELDRLYAEDPLSFCRYCLNDADLVLEILEKRDLISHTIERAALTGAGIDKAWTSVASFERVYAEGLFLRGVLDPLSDPARKVSGAAGGTVLDPATGMFDNVAVFDFRSLYPSIIRTFNIDPLAYERARFCVAEDEVVRAPNGAAFERTPGILPALIAEYFSERLAALDRGDDAAAFVYKILMNSFYGVLGSANCKYARTELAGAITSFGKMCLHFARDFFVDRGYRVLYGDTDSVFVEMKSGEASASISEMATALNSSLADYIRERYQCDSFIGIRFEKLYLRFFIPRLRSHVSAVHEVATGGGLETGDDPVSERGRAKGYAGLRDCGDGTTEIEIKGMEAARSDYTPLARRFQTELLGLLFRERNTAIAEAYIRDQVINLFKGELDEELIYRKKIRRDPDSYIASTPPHIKVARALGWKHRKGTVEYLMTVNGPEAVSMLRSPVDYAWYAESQLVPIAVSAGLAAGFDAEAIFRTIHANGQLEFDWDHTRNGGEAFVPYAL
jgi:DNA polymerase-2